jgi:putative ABC transport system ATP-binding protein
VAVARALINRPPLLLADEPTGAVDAEAGATITELLRDLNLGGQTVLLVTHDPALARLVATRVVEVRDGKLTEAVSVSSRSAAERSPAAANEEVPS